jgi:hypothetical protein
MRHVIEREDLLSAVISNDIGLDDLIAALQAWGGSYNKRWLMDCEVLRSFDRALNKVHKLGKELEHV